ncbi:MAG TPA: hypothetical protein VII02_01820 [Gemmatimonadaceae bacterium]
MPSPAPEAPLLNEHQHRHFEVYLSMLQDALAEIEALAAPAAGRPDGLIWYHDDLPSGFDTAILPLLVSLRESIRQLAMLLDVAPQRRSRLRLIRALATSAIVRLDDSYAEKLRGYGAVDPRAGPRINPILDQIRTDLGQLLSSSAVRRAESSASPETSDPG